MTDFVFKKEMQRMYSLFGEKAYPQERLWSIWKACKDLPDDSFRWIVNTFIDTCKYAPLPKEFKELAYREKVRLGIEVKEPETKRFHECSCKDCGDSGNLFVVRKEQFEPWAKWPRGVIRCDCEVGRKRPASQGPIWNQAIGRSYDKDSIHLNVKGDWMPTQARRLVSMVREFAGKEEKSSIKSGELKKVDFFSPDPEGAA